jgi:cytidylate kinase
VIIAIDGPAGSGKSTIAREVAKRLGLRYVDTGAMYRAVTLLALEAGLVPDRLKETGPLAEGTTIRLEGRCDDLSRVFVDGREVTDDIRGRLVSQHVSAVSADPAVRRVLTSLQRREAEGGDVVLEGRDMGTVVVPDAGVKVFLTASIDERARRRQLQLAAKGTEQAVEELTEEIATRDTWDSERAVAPLRRAEDAVEIDTTAMSIDEVVAAVCRLVEGRKMGGATEAGAGEESTTLLGEEERPADRWPLSRVVKGPFDTRLYRATHVVLGPVWRLAYRMEVSGVEYFPRGGPVLLVCNHRGMTDPFFIGINAPRQIHYMAKVELWKFKPLGWAMNAYGTFPVVRGEADRTAIKRGVEILESGAVLGLFPEGGVRQGDQLASIRAGIGLFALRQGVVTIPAALWGTDRVVRKGLPRLPQVRLAFGAPLELPEPGLPKSERTRIVADRATEAINKLLAGLAARE